MHEGRRPKRRFAGITRIKIRRKIPTELLRIADRNFIEQIVRMLSVVKRLPIPSLAGLEEQRITAPAFGQQIEAHHPAKTELRIWAKRMRIHRHEPVRRI